MASGCSLLGQVDDHQLEFGHFFDGVAQPFTPHTRVFDTTVRHRIEPPCGHVVDNGSGRQVPVKLIAEQHVMEDCGFIPTVQDWLAPIKNKPVDWMLKVQKKTTTELEVI